MRTLTSKPCSWARGRAFGASIPSHGVDAEGCVALVNLVTSVQRRADRGSSDRGITTDQLTAVSGGIDKVDTRCTRRGHVMPKVSDRPVLEITNRYSKLQTAAA
jgi:hypothetical protein